MSSEKIIKEIQVWTDGETKTLLGRYEEYMAEVGPLHKFRNKKAMWQQISEDMTKENMSKTAKQCEERYKTILKRKKTAIDNNNTSGAKRQAVPYEEELAKICSADDSIEPEIQLSSQHAISKAPMSIVSPPNKKKTMTVPEALLEIAKKKEEGKERRHKERLETAKLFISAIEKLGQN